MWGVMQQQPEASLPSLGRRRSGTPKHLQQQRRRRPPSAEKNEDVLALLEELRRDFEETRRAQASRTARVEGEVEACRRAVAAVEPSDRLERRLRSEVERARVELMEQQEKRRSEERNRAVEEARKMAAMVSEAEARLETQAAALAKRITEDAARSAAAWRREAEALEKSLMAERKARRELEGCAGATIDAAVRGVARAARKELSEVAARAEVADERARTRASRLEKAVRQLDAGERALGTRLERTRVEVGEMVASSDRRRAADRAAVDRSLEAASVAALAARAVDRGLAQAATVAAAGEVRRDSARERREIEDRATSAIERTRDDVDAAIAVASARIADYVSAELAPLRDQVAAVSRRLELQHNEILSARRDLEDAEAAATRHENRLSDTTQALAAATRCQIVTAIRHVLKSAADEAQKLDDAALQPLAETLDVIENSLIPDIFARIYGLEAPAPAVAC